MRASRTLGVVAGTAALGLAALGLAAPASSATLPPGQKITIIEALDETSPAEGTFFTVNPANAASSAVGTGTGFYTTGVDVNDDGIGFAIGFTAVGDVFGPTLWDADASTGTLTNGRSMFYLSGDRPGDCEGIDLNPSTAELLVACVSLTPDGPVSTINVVEKATGQLTVVVALDGDDFQDFDAIATNPVTGVLWGFGPFGADYSFIIDLALGTSVGIAPMDNNVNGADFDRNGQLFLASELYIEGDDVEYPSLAVTDPSADDFTSNAFFVDTADDTTMIAVRSLTVWGKLAATGASAAEMLPVTVGTVLLLLAGAALLATSRLGRRRA